MFQILNIFSKTFLFGCYGNKAYLTLSYTGGGGAQSARANFKESYLRNEHCYWNEIWRLEINMASYDIIMVSRDAN